MTRAETITTLLEHLVDYETTLIRTGNPGDHHPPAMPAMYHHPSVRELYRTLDRLYAFDRTAHAHLQAYYRSEWRTTNKTRRVKDHKRKPHTVTQRVRERIISDWIIIDATNRGVTWIVRNFQGEPFLPDELRTELVA